MNRLILKYIIMTVIVIIGACIGAELLHLTITDNAIFVLPWLCNCSFWGILLASVWTHDNDR